MATIQIREIPEDAYETLRRRARRNGQSIQAYMRDQVVQLAARPSKAEAIEHAEVILARQPVDYRYPREELLADLDAGRR